MTRRPTTRTTSAARLLSAVVVALMLLVIATDASADPLSVPSKSRPAVKGRISPQPTTPVPLSKRGDKRAAAAGSLWKTIGSLSLIVGLILVATRYLKQKNNTAAGGVPVDVVELLGKRPLDARVTIHLVRLGTRILVLGVTADGVRTLAEVDDPAEVDRLAGLCRTAENNTAASPFQSLLQRFGGSQAETHHHTAPPSPAEEASPEQKLAERMRSAQPALEQAHA